MSHDLDLQSDPLVVDATLMVGCNFCYPAEALVVVGSLFVLLEAGIRHRFYLYSIFLYNRKCCGSATPVV